MRREKSCEQLQAKMKRKTPLMKWLQNCKITNPNSGFLESVAKICLQCVLVRDELEKYITAGKSRAGGGRSRFIESGRVFGAEEYADVSWYDWACHNVVQVVASWRLGSRERERERLWESENPSPVKNGLDSSVDAGSGSLLGISHYNLYPVIKNIINGSSYLW